MNPQDKAEPTPGKDAHTDKAKEHSRRGDNTDDDQALKEHERSGPQREHNG